VSWAQRLSDEAEPALRLAAGWAALAAARHRYVGGAAGRDATLRHVRVLGRRWREAGDLESLRRRLPSEAAWVLEDLTDSTELWRAERRWWHELELAGRRWLRQPASGVEALVGAFALLLADAHRVQAAIEIAAWRGVEEDAVDEIL
jgi:hypothetical protein